MTKQTPELWLNDEQDEERAEDDLRIKAYELTEPGEDDDYENESAER